MSVVLEARARRWAGLVVLAVIVAAPGVAAAAKVTHTLEGAMVGDANSSVKLKVVVKNGEPSKVKALTYENLDAFCNEDGTTITPAGELSGNAGKALNRRVEFDNSFNWFSNPADPSRRVELFGKLKQKGKKAVGTIGVFANDTCAAAKGQVKLAK